MGVWGVEGKGQALARPHRAQDRGHGGRPASIRATSTVSIVASSVLPSAAITRARQRRARALSILLNMGVSPNPSPARTSQQGLDVFHIRVPLMFVNPVETKKERRRDVAWDYTL